MLRYRCPQCTQLLQTNELRAGKKSVCIGCLATHIIPIDRSFWLAENGEPLYTQTPSISHSTAAGQPTAPLPPEAREGIEDRFGHYLREPEKIAPHDYGDPTEPARTDRPTHEGKGASEPAAGELEVVEAVPIKPEASDALAAAEPVHVQTQAEIAAALTEVLTHRMKPPRMPKRDLRLSTAGWMILTGLGVAFLLVSLFTAASYETAAIGVGMVQILIGYAWIIWLTYNRSPQRGLICAVPPLTLYYLTQWRYAKYRPLRFVATGAVLVCVAFLAAKIAPTTRGLLASNSRKTIAPTIDPADMSKLDKLRDFKKQRAYDKLIDLLHEITNTDSLKSVDAKDGPDLVIELKSLCSHPDSGVKVAAMAAFSQWGPSDEARDICMIAIQSPSQEERLMAIQLLPKWKDTDAAHEVARAVASLIGRPGIESNRAETALVEIGGAAAERATIGLFYRSKDDRTIRIVALSILEKVGGVEAVTALRSSANVELDQPIKTKMLETIEAIQMRIGKKT